jgi:hypothetical protein
MSNTLKPYNIVNKSNQQSHVYLGNAIVDKSGNDINDCVDRHLFSSIVGSKNVFITPLSSDNVRTNIFCGRNAQLCSVYEYFVEGSTIMQGEITISDTTTSYHRFISLDTRWYDFKDVNSQSGDYTSYMPNCFLSSVKKENGELSIEWRSLTSDGSVLIKPDSNSKVFWNGIDYVTDENAYHSSEEEFNNIYMKTMKHIDIIQNDYKDSSTILYKKYADENLWQSSYITKKVRGSDCLEVNSTVNDINISIKDNCNYPTDGIMNNEVFIGRFNQFESIKDNSSLIETYRQALLQSYEENGSNMHWLSQFEYNVFNQLFNIGYISPTISADIKLIEVNFSSLCLRQNKFYGIGSDGLRNHHILSSGFKYNNNESMQHNTFTESLETYPIIIKKSTESITNGRIIDGLYRVIVPPGAVFRTLKAIPGFHSLYEKNYGNTNADELHFAVDVYGNILGEKSLSSPSIVRYTNSTESSKLSDYDSVPQSEVNSLILDIWNSYYNNNSSSFNEALIQELNIIKGANGISFTSPHVYINSHHLPIWVESDIFIDYIINMASFIKLYDNIFKPISFYTSSVSLEFDKAVNHSKQIKDNTYWNEIIKRYEIGVKVNDFSDNRSHWQYDGKELEND